MRSNEIIFLLVHISVLIIIDERAVDFSVVRVQLEKIIQQHQHDVVILLISIADYVNCEVDVKVSVLVKKAF